MKRYIPLSAGVLVTAITLLPQPPATHLQKIKQEVPHAIKKLPAHTITAPAVLLAAVFDGIDPAMFAVLILLLTSILAHASRATALIAGLAFCVAAFISYMLMGFGLYSLIAASGISGTLYLAFALISILFGSLGIKNYFGRGRWHVVKKPKELHPFLQKLARNASSVPGAFVAGFISTIFLLPYSSGPYIVVLGLLAHIASRTYTLGLLVLYNLIVITPLILISFAMYSGVISAQEIQTWRTDHLELINLCAGILLIIIGAAMLAARYFGMA